MHKEICQSNTLGYVIYADNCAVFKIRTKVAINLMKIKLRVYYYTALSVKTVAVRAKKSSKITFCRQRHKVTTIFHGNWFKEDSVRIIDKIILVCDWFVNI